MIEHECRSLLNKEAPLFCITYGEITLQTNNMGVFPQKECTESMKSSKLDQTRVTLAKNCTQALSHFISSFVGESHGADRGRRDAMMENKVGNSGRQNLRNSSIA